jgi:hypothetical protein
MNSSMAQRFRLSTASLAAATSNKTPPIEAAYDRYGSNAASHFESLTHATTQSDTFPCDFGP